MNLNIEAGSASEPSGLLLIDKPEGISSFDIIRRLRRQTGVRKIGHAGTLDPAATGLMLMLFGGATKQANRLVGLDKLYQAEITLGKVSSTGDREGELTASGSLQPSLTAIKAAIAGSTGTITQIPSQYSAIKVGGVRAYKLARAGKIIQMPPRHVTIYSIELRSYSYPKLCVITKVSSGTYIRSLAQDLGAQLATGAYLSQLRRLEIGPFAVDQAYQLDDINAPTLRKQLVHPSA